MLKAADVEPYFRAALRSFSAEPTSFADLFVAYETIKQSGDVGSAARERGYKYIKAQGWASADDLEDFYKTAHLYRHGQPTSPMELPRKEMSLAAAKDLVRQLLFRWAQELTS
jgi:hypothetical protein